MKTIVAQPSNTSLGPPGPGGVGDAADSITGALYEVGTVEADSVVPAPTVAALGREDTA